jgi:hypothetical protein
MIKKMKNLKMYLMKIKTQMDIIKMEIREVWIKKAELVLKCKKVQEEGRKRNKILINQPFHLEVLLEFKVNNKKFQIEIRNNNQMNWWTNMDTMELRKRLYFLRVDRRELVKEIWEKEDYQKKMSKLMKVLIKKWEMIVLLKMIRMKLSH